MNDVGKSRLSPRYDFLIGGSAGSRKPFNIQDIFYLCDKPRRNLLS